MSKKPKHEVRDEEEEHLTLMDLLKRIQVNVQVLHGEVKKNSAVTFKQVRKQTLSDIKEVIIRVYNASDFLDTINSATRDAVAEMKHRLIVPRRK